MERGDYGLSYSMIQTALTCHKKYQYLYVDKIKPEGPSSGDMSFGTAIHTGLQDLLEGGQGRDVFDIYWDSEKDRDLKYGAFPWERLKTLGHTFLDRFEARHQDKFTNVHAIEKRMYGEMGDIKLEGTADYIGDFDGVPTVLDFKTSRSAYDKAKILHNPQLYMYAELARITTGFEAKQITYMVFVKHPEARIQTISIELTPERRARMNAIVAESAEDIVNKTQAGTFPRNPNGCMMGAYKCDYFDKCFPEA